jgi:hypothetical protein
MSDEGRCQDIYTVVYMPYPDNCRKESRGGQAQKMHRLVLLKDQGKKKRTADMP